ncbi:hypothetical protein VZT92_026150 [Zoarces viviparus]|uniref:Uncharacterized protein n=1 Tax=Zoarces viviparus TaxID=48416 RepID=A0AAW1DZJ9_ZOAVI
MRMAQDAAVSLLRHTSRPHATTLRRPRLCQWALQYLITGPTCPHCHTQACPICLSNPAGTSWLDSLHADRWTIVG